MAKKNDDFTFDAFVRGTEAACDAANMVCDAIANYDPETLQTQLDALHQVEHRGDEIKHDLVAQVARAFITPLERDDILTLIQAIDNVTDAVEDILIRMRITGVRRMRSDAIDFAKLLVRCTDATRQLMQEFRHFKKSKKLNEYIILVNHIEEEGDAMYMEAMRRLHTGVEDLLQLVIWREIYDFFERCFDACEDVADILENMAIGNT